MKITIFGTGYVWLVAGTCFAELGHEVLCIDVDEEKIQKLTQGIIPIYEPGLSELVLKNHKNWNLNFSTDAKSGVLFWEVIISAVGTPPDRENSHKADLKYVKQVAKTFGQYTDSYKVFVNKSTVPVGTGEICREIIESEIQARGENIDFDVASNPEFLREWNAIGDFMKPDRVVLWVENTQSEAILKKLYAPISDAWYKVIMTNIKSAEVIKYASNAFLATKLSFINEIANFAEAAWADIEDITRGMWSDTRIWSKFLNAWIGYGWSCFPKDIEALLQTGKEYGVDFKILADTQKVNERQKLVVIDKLQKHIDIEWKTIAIWGLSYKPDTDDIRDAPSIQIMRKLLELWVSEIRVYDPEAMGRMKELFTDHTNSIVFCENKEMTVTDSDALLLLTEWGEFKNPDFTEIANQMKWNIIIDGRNIWKNDNIDKLGIKYEWIGR